MSRLRSLTQALAFASVTMAIIPSPKPVEALLIGAAVKEPMVFIAGAGLIAVGAGQMIYYGTRPLQYYMDRKGAEILNSLDQVKKQNDCENAARKEKRKRVLLGLGMMALGIVAEEKQREFESTSIVDVLRRKVESGEISQDVANKVNVDLSTRKIKIRLSPTKKDGTLKTSAENREDLFRALAKQHVAPETQAFLSDLWMPQEIESK